MVPIRSNLKDHRIRLNDQEIEIIAQAIRAYPYPEYTREQRKAQKLVSRLITLGSCRR